MIGTQIGPFVLLRLLGAGGMGRVYLAEHSLMKDLHAIKILDPQLTQHPEVVTRFINEARAAARLRHRNLIRVHNIERLPGEGSWYMVLDYLDGRTLAQFMGSHRAPMPLHLVLRILAQVGNCIQHVHDHRIVHRDLKPDNIFLVRAGDDPHVPIVLDLGVAQLNEEMASGPVTRTGTVLGTPLYMAPEQLRGERVSAAADVFALGAIAYEMSTGGYFPYQREEQRSAYLSLPATEIYFRQRTMTAVDPRRHAELGDAWANALLAALDPDPAGRPASARELVLQLASAVVPDGVHPGGVEIVGRVASELMQDRGASIEGVASLAPIDDTSSVAAGAPEHSDGPLSVYGDVPSATVLNVGPTAISTLAGSASQSVEVRRGRRWGIVAGAAVVSVLAGVLGLIILGRSNAPAIPQVTGPDPKIAAETHPPPAANVLPPEMPPSASTAIPQGRPALDAGVDAIVETVAEQPRADRDAARPRTDARAVEPSRHAPPTPGAPRPKPSPAVTPPRPGMLRIHVRPWAEVWVNDKSFGQTPIDRKVAPGEYRVRLKNGSHDETTSITVRSDQEIPLERNW